MKPDQKKQTGYNLLSPNTTRLAFISLIAKQSWFLAVTLYLPNCHHL